MKTPNLNMPILFNLFLSYLANLASSFSIPGNGRLSADWSFGENHLPSGQTGASYMTYNWVLTVYDQVLLHVILVHLHVSFLSC